MSLRRCSACCHPRGGLPIQENNSPQCWNLSALNLHFHESVGGANSSIPAKVGRVVQRSMSAMQISKSAHQGAVLPNCGFDCWAASIRARAFAPAQIAWLRLKNSGTHCSLLPLFACEGHFVWACEHCFQRCRLLCQPLASDPSQK